MLLSGAVCVSIEKAINNTADARSSSMHNLRLLHTIPTVKQEVHVRLLTCEIRHLQESLQLDCLGGRHQGGMHVM